MTRMMKYVVFGLLLTALSRAEAQTINAASCSQTDVQAAFSAINNSTVTINIPACASTGWTGNLTLTIPSGNTNHVALLGAGSLTTTGGGDLTVIADNNTTNGNPILSVSVPSNGFFRMAGITFNEGTGGSQVKYNGLVSINGSTTNIRVDHSHFNTASSQASMLQWQGCAYGVVDHSIFDGAGVSNAVRAYNSGSCNGDSLGVGDQAWTQPTGFGGANFLFMENNVFNSGASNDCTKAGRFVARFNTYNSTSPAPTTQTHPTGGAGRERGCRAEEVYKNSFLPVSANYINAAIWISSGGAIIWGNTTTSSSAGGGTGYHNFIELLSMRQNNSTYPQGAPPTGWGYCGTSSGLSGDGSNWDGSQGATGYPCLDQPGSGPGDLLTGGFTSDGSGSNNVTNSATGCTSSSSCAYPRQARDPIYEFMDSYAPVPSNPSVLLANAAVSGALTNNVDYYLWCNASSQSGCTSFTGATGTGSGTLASRPATCTTGVAYWATDQGSWNQSGSGGQGELFKCTATNTWTLYYTPYTYPHPLTNTQGSAPASPANLVGIVQ